MFRQKLRQKILKFFYLALIGVLLAAVSWVYTNILPSLDNTVTPTEHHALWAIIFIAFGGIAYLLMLRKQVKNAPTGTREMEEVASATREGSKAYLAAQFKRLSWVVVAMAAILVVTYSGPHQVFRWGRASAFVFGCLFSWLVGYVGMNMATQGNLCRRCFLTKLWRSDADRVPHRDHHGHVDR